MIAPPSLEARVRAVPDDEPHRELAPDIDPGPVDAADVVPVVKVDRERPTLGDGLLVVVGVVASDTLAIFGIIALVRLISHG